MNRNVFWSQSRPDFKLRFCLRNPIRGGLLRIGVKKRYALSLGVQKQSQVRGKG